MTTLQTGAPHFKSLMKQFRHANYTLSKALNEFVDNTIKRATKIDVFTQVDDNQRLQELRVSDNIESGFDNLDQLGTSNPFNMGHIKIAHEDDAETSEFGVGMKAGALSAANQLNVYTRIARGDGTFKYVEVICDFIRMAETPDVNDSYNPFIREISYEEYKMNHTFEQGSTIKLSKIRECIYPRTTQPDITKDICAELSATYTRFLSPNKRSVITVNGTKVDPIYDFFEDPKCSPFTVTKEMFILEKEGLPRQYIIRQTKENTTWQEYCREEDKWPKLKTQVDGLEYIAGLRKNGYRFAYAPFNSDGVCLQLNTTLAFYSDRYHTQNELPMPEDCLLIYKDDRCYGKESLFTHNNGTHNYTLHEMDFMSKRIGKDIGITFHKEILMNGKNELIMAIKSALVDSKRGFTADTSSAGNMKLCEKAIKIGILNPKTCPPQKLHTEFRSAESTSGSDAESVTYKTRKPRSSKKRSVAPSPSPSVPSPSPPVVAPEEISSSPTPEDTVDPDPLTIIEEDQQVNVNIRRRRTIEIIVRLQKMVADEIELSEESLSAIESAIA